MKVSLILCALSLAHASEDITPENRNLGGDLDDNGCLTSGGYSWCESQSKCIRSWEEDCEDEDDTVTVGDDRDESGCIASAGYAWCESQSKCLRSWEEDCEDEDDSDTVTVGNDRDDSGCISSAGFVWCEYLQDCVQLWTLDVQSAEECDASSDDSSSEDTVLGGEFEGVEDGTGSDDSEGDSYNYDRKAKIRVWLIRFFAIAGPFFVCVFLLIIRNKRKRQREAQRNVMIQMLSDGHHNSQANVAMETIAVKNKVKASGPAYEAFTNAV